MKKFIISKRKIVFLVAVLFFAATYFVGFAEEVKLVNPLGDDKTDFKTVIDRVMSWLVEIGAPIAAVMVIVGGMQMLFSSGNPEKFKKGQQTILYTAIGYGIIILGAGLIKIIEALLKG